MEDELVGIEIRLRLSFSVPERKFEGAADIMLNSTAYVLQLYFGHDQNSNLQIIAGKKILLDWDWKTEHPAGIQRILLDLFFIPLQEQQYLTDPEKDSIFQHNIHTTISRRDAQTIKRECKILAFVPMAS